MSRQAPQEDVERALQAARGGDCVVIAAETSSVNLRWAGNTLTTNGVARSRQLTVIAINRRAAGTSVGVVSRAGVRDDQVEDVVRAAEQAIDSGAAADTLARFVAITAKFRDVLQLHARMLTRVKNASEGIVRAIATEVERASAPMRPYGPRPDNAPKSSGAMVFNQVV